MLAAGGSCGISVSSPIKSGTGGRGASGGSGGWTTAGMDGAERAVNVVAADGDSY